MLNYGITETMELVCIDDNILHLRKLRITKFYLLQDKKKKNSLRKNEHNVNIFS